MSIRNPESTGYGSGVTPINGESEDPEASNSYSVIDRHSNFDGTFRSSRDLRIDGEVKGTIECEGTLFVAQGANVSAKVEAENIAVAGNLTGEIRCRGRLHLMPSGRVHGKVSTITLVINEGAYYEGQLEMAAPEDRLASNAPRPLTPKAVNSAPVAIQPQQTQQPKPAAPPVADAAGGASASTFIRRLGGPETPWNDRAEDETADSESDTTNS